MKKKNRKKKTVEIHDFVVGYHGDTQVIYGSKSFIYGKYRDVSDYCHKMTLNQAKKNLKQLYDGDARIYQLIDITDAVLNDDLII